MNKLMHSAINKFNNINIMCGTLALEIESGAFSKNDTPLLEKRLKELVKHIDKDFEHGKNLLAEITAVLKDSLNCYSENEHFLKTINSSVALLESRYAELKNNLADNNYNIPTNNLIISLHVIEEKGLACGIILNELKGVLIKSGKYTQK